MEKTADVNWPGFLGALAPRLPRAPSWPRRRPPTATGGLLAAMLVAVAAAMGAAPAAAGDAEDCAGKDHEKAIPACTRLIDGGKQSDRSLAWSYYARGNGYAAKGDHDRSIADFTKAIEIDPRYAWSYYARGASHAAKGDHDRSIADFTKAIAIDPRYAAAYNNRGIEYAAKSDDDRAIADFTKAIEIDPRYAVAYSNRGDRYAAKGDNDRAIADYERALVEAGQKTDAWNLQVGQRATAALAKLKTSGPIASAAEPTRPVASVPAAPTRRHALVIANSAYSEFTRLANPEKDAKAMAAAFRRLGFDEVTERSDLTRAGLTEALRDFGDKAAGADWAVVYYAGHGLQHAGTNYLVPVDARLLKERHVEDEAVSLDRVLANVREAKKIRLVILDACRNNPYLPRMEVADGKRAGQSRGLSRVEPSGGVLVAFAARDGQVADDGEGGENSPFAAALLSTIEQPGLEIGKVFRKVRAIVMDRTKGEQEPVIYGALPDEDLYFKAAEAR